MSYLILVRHGQSVWNLENRFTGWVDVDLYDNGRAQAKKAGELIKEQKLNIDQYYSSFQLRAKNTLKIIQELFLFLVSRWRNHLIYYRAANYYQHIHR